MKLDITTPFAMIAKVGAEAHWDLRQVMKSAEVKAYHNDSEYQWNLEISSESLSKGHIKSEIITPFPDWTSVSIEGDFDITSLSKGHINFKIMTPLPDWTSVSIEGDFDITKMPYMFKFVLDKEGVVNTVEGNLNIDGNTVNIQLSTTVPGLESITISCEGQMMYKSGYVKFLAESPIPGFTSVDIQAKYDFQTNIKLAEADLKVEGDSKHFYVKTEVKNNNFHIELHTPFEGFEEIKMIGDYTAQHGKHTVLASFEKEHVRYDYNADITLT